MSDPREDAYARVERHIGYMHQQILTYMAAAAKPVTPDEVAAGIRMPFMTVRVRFTELYQSCRIEREGTGRSQFGNRQYRYILRPPSGEKG